MKAILLSTLLLAVSISIQGQTWENINCNDLPINSLYCVGTANAATISPSSEPHLFSVNEMDSSNIWVYGNSTKPFFSELGWVTDSIESYGVNLKSELVVSIPTESNGLGVSWLLFEHKYATDSLLDGGYLEYSCDSMNWSLVPLYDGSGWPSGVEIENFGSILHDTIDAFTGLQSDWKWSAVEFTWQWPRFQEEASRSFSNCHHSNVDTIHVRFVFESDSIETNKAGWMIRNIMIGGEYEDLGSSIDEMDQNPLKIYPNPTSEFVRFDLPKNEPNPSTIQVYDMVGREVLTIPYQPVLDVSGLSLGNYIVTVTVEEKTYRQLLMVE